MLMDVNVRTRLDAICNDQSITTLEGRFHAVNDVDDVHKFLLYGALPTSYAKKGKYAKLVYDTSIWRSERAEDFLTKLTHGRNPDFVSRVLPQVLRCSVKWWLSDEANIFCGSRVNDKSLFPTEKWSGAPYRIIRIIIVIHHIVDIIRWQVLHSADMPCSKYTNPLTCSAASTPYCEYAM